MKRRKATANADRPTKTARKKAQIAKLRIIGGQMRGRTIQYHGAEFTRPMKDNIRENLFNILGPAVRNTICYDLFSGTGALAFESISRGASKAVAVEQSRHAVGFIRKTAEQLDISDRFQVLQGNAFRLSSELLGPPDRGHAVDRVSEPTLCAVERIAAAVDHDHQQCLAAWPSWQRVGCRNGQAIRYRQPAAGRLGHSPIRRDATGIHRTGHAVRAAILAAAPCAARSSTHGAWSFPKRRRNQSASSSQPAC